MPTIYRYTPHVEAGPDGRQVRHITNDMEIVQLCRLDGQVYISVPDGITLPEQPPEITLEQVTMTPQLRARLKASASPVAVSKQITRQRIRNVVGDAEDQIADLEKRLAMAERLLYTLAVPLMQGQSVPQEIADAYLAFVQQYVDGVSSGAIEARSDAEFVSDMLGYLTDRSNQVAAAAKVHVAVIDELLPAA